MKAFFADTFYWIALANRGDAFHDQVLEFSRSIDLPALLTFCAFDGQLRRDASLLVSDVLSDEMVRVIPQTRQSFLSGFSQTMRHLGLTDALTNDRHFEQEGFRALFRE